MSRPSFLSSVFTVAGGTALAQAIALAALPFITRLYPPELYGGFVIFLAWGGFLQRVIEPQLNTIWAITDFTRDNGATRVAPGSQLWDEARHAEEHELTCAEMTAGSVILYTGSVIHSGGANLSEADRIGINITYSLGWLRQEENQYLSCPPDIAATLAPELQRLIGYSMGSYALGYFTPPLAPGQGPEIVPPEALFSGEVKNWGDDLYAKLAARTGLA